MVYDLRLVVEGRQDIKKGEHRSSHRRCSIKKLFLKFRKIHGETLLVAASGNKTSVAKIQLTVTKFFFSMVPKMNPLKTEMSDN